MEAEDMDGLFAHVRMHAGGKTCAGPARLFHAIPVAAAPPCRRVLRETGRLLGAFTWGALGTVAGSLLAFWLMPLRVLGADGWKVAAALTARHIGGSVNFVAVHGGGCSKEVVVQPLA